MFYFAEYVFLYHDIQNVLNMLSHPVWVRGLKPAAKNGLQKGIESHPVWVRGLKLLKKGLLTSEIASHPVWVRGLKQYMQIKLIL